MYYVFILIPALVYVLIGFYNHKSPIFFGMPFFYWFQIGFLVVSSIFYFIAVAVSKDD